MQNAPSVIYPAGHSAFYRWVLIALGALAALLIAFGWFSSWVASPWNASHALWAGGMGVWLIWVVSIWKTGHSKPAGALHWNAQAAPADWEGHPGAWMWRWSDSSRAPVAVGVSLVLDGQSRLLVRVHGLPSVGRWLWLEQKTDPLRWDDLRRAMAAHARQA